MLYLVIALHVLVPAVSVIIYSKLRGGLYPEKIEKGIALYFVFAFAMLFFLYTVIWIRGWAYHSWLYAGLTGEAPIVYGLRRMIIPAILSVVLPLVLHFYRKLADKFLKEDDFDGKTLWQFAHFTLVLFAMLLLISVSIPLVIATSAGTIIEAGVLSLVTLAISVISIIFGLTVFVLKWRYKYIETLLAAALSLLFINAFIFPFDAGILDGVDTLQGIGDNLFPIFRNALLFLVLAGLMIALRKQLRFLAVPLILFIAVYTAINFNTMHTMREQRSVADEEAFDAVSTFSSERNIIVIALDMLQGSVVERTFTTNPELYDAFSGFTVFTRAMSSFPFTTYSQNSIQSGLVYASDDFLWRDANLRSYEDSFMTDMQNEGFEVNLLGTLFEHHRQDLFPYVSRVVPLLQGSAYASISSAALGRLFGYWIRSPISEILFGGEEEWKRTAFAVYIEDMLNCIAATEMLIERASVTDEENRLLYFWNYGTHAPHVVSRDGTLNLEPGRLTWYATAERIFLDEAYFFFSQLARLFERMKELDVYDNSLIIIVSDHGTFFDPGVWDEHGIYMDDVDFGIGHFGNFRPIQMYNAVLMVKPPNAEGFAEITHDVAWNGDVRELINRYFENFANMSPIEVMADIRAENPEIGVLFAPAGLPLLQVSNSKEFHHILYVNSFFDIPSAFAEHSSTAE